MSSSAFTEKIFLGTPGTLLKFFCRIIQTILGLTITLCYGSEIINAHKHNGGYNHAWGFAVVIGVLSCITAPIFCIKRVKSFSFFFVDGLYVVFWAIVTGIFGAAYLNTSAPVKGAPPTVGPNIGRMKAVAWLDLVILVMWVYTWISSMVLWLRIKSSLRSRA
jgi:hypothetical protein